MLLNFLKIAFRNLLKHKLSSIINILGLSVSLASCLLLFLHAHQELSYDRDHGKRLFRITSTIKQRTGNIIFYPTSPVILGPRALAEIPEITNLARLASASFFQTNDVIKYGNKLFYIDNGTVVDTAIFSLLKFDIIAGNRQLPIAHDNAVAIEKEWAEKLFDSTENAIGKIVNISTILGPSDYEITAVFDNSTILSHLMPSYIISMENTPWAKFMNDFSEKWDGDNLVFTYIELTPEADPEIVNKKIHQVLLASGLKEMEETGVSQTMNLQPIEDIHTSSGFTYDMNGNTDISLVKVPIAIGSLILLLACFNYINLSTAQAGRRSLEIGIRKTLGVTTAGLRRQFLGESLLLVLIASLLSIIMAALALPFFNQMVETPVILGFHNLGSLALISGGFLLITAFLAGFYPAIYLSTFKPVEVLKGKSLASKTSNALRKSLVVIQFVISITLISTIIIISQQVNFLENKDLGFTSKSKLVLPNKDKDAAAKYKTLKDRFTSFSGVNAVSGVNYVPGTHITIDIPVYKQGKSKEDAVAIYFNHVDLNYPQLMDIKLAGGRYFTDFPKDPNLAARVLINRLAAEQLDIPVEDAIDEVLYYDGEGVRLKYQVIGVFENINQNSLHDKIMPMALALHSNILFSNIIIDANLANLPSLIADLEREWTAQINNVPFEYFMLDDHLRLQYAKEYKTFDLIKSFALISLIISCLGLYALSMYIAESRFKEIGVRKVFGASDNDILLLVSRDLSLLIFIAFLVSIPISIYSMNIWLETFAYRITPGVSTYLIAGLISVGIGWLTIIYQSLRASRTNPINVLKDE